MKNFVRLGHNKTPSAGTVGPGQKGRYGESGAIQGGGSLTAAPQHWLDKQGPGSTLNDTPRIMVLG